MSLLDEHLPVVTPLWGIFSLFIHIIMMDDFNFSCNIKEKQTTRLGCQKTSFKISMNKRLTKLIFPHTNLSDLIPPLSVQIVSLKEIVKMIRGLVWCHYLCKIIPILTKLIKTNYNDKYIWNTWV